MNEQAGPNGNGVPAYRRPPAELVVNVEIDELIFDGFGPLDSRRVSSRHPGSRHQTPGRPDTERAAETFRNELARELADAMTGAAAEQLAPAIADAVFRQLTAPRQRRGPQSSGGAR
jgi:hypothetical protein